MMRNILSALTLGAAMITSPALAQEMMTPERIDRDITFEGSAQRACRVTPASAVRELNATLQPSDGSSLNVQLTPQGFIDPTTGVAQATEIALSLPVTCNAPHRIRVSSTQGALLREGASVAAGDFRSRLDFRVNLEFAGQSATFDTTSTASAEVNLSEAATGNAVVTISIPGGGTPLVAGAYSDTLIVEIEAGS